MAMPMQMKYTQKVVLRMRCEGLKNKDVMSKSDPMIVLTMKESPQSQSWKEVGRTEMISDCLKPRFMRPVNMEYRFEETQHICFSIYDVDGAETDPVSKFDFLGDVKCTLAEVISQGVNFKKDISLGGHLFVSSESVNENGLSITFNLAGSKLDKKDTFGKSDPYLIFYTVNGTERFPVHKTEIIKNTLNPSWAPFTLSCQTLCNGDLKRPIYIECFDWDSVGKHDLIGSLTTTAEQMLAQPFPCHIPLINQKKKEKKGIKYENSGTLVINRAEMVKDYNFIEYLQGGMEINLVVAVDFTGSNRDPTDPNSLHYFSGSQMNNYQQAIMSVGSVLEFYDSDKLFPVYGFGMKIPDGTVSHCFPLTGNLSQPQVLGVNGMLEVYASSIQKYPLWGPTYFEKVITSAAAFTAQNRLDPTKQKYTILLILTDGEINDMQQTTDAIVEASGLPMSVIIVGIGNADFSSMDQLDADTKPLVHSKTGKKSQRDIVQFVPFNNFKTQHISVLAREVLYEVPMQVVSYMKSVNLKPLVMQQATDMMAQVKI